MQNKIYEFLSLRSGGVARYSYDFGKSFRDVNEKWVDRKWEGRML